MTLGLSKILYQFISFHLNEKFHRKNFLVLKHGHANQYKMQFFSEVIKLFNDINPIYLKLIQYEHWRKLLNLKLRIDYLLNKILLLLHHLLQVFFRLLIMNMICYHSKVGLLFVKRLFELLNLFDPYFLDLLMYVMLFMLIILIINLENEIILQLLKLHKLLDI